MMRRFPDKLYTAAQVRELDRSAIDGFGVSAARLMERAGTAAYHVLRRRWPRARRIAVVCGTGNNGGDGFVLARLAQEAGLALTILQVGDQERLRDAALAACRQLQLANVTIDSFSARHLASQDLIVDAILGTGLNKPVDGAQAAAIGAINAARTPVLALDLPSGLNADTGAPLGAAVRATATLCFVGMKRGLLTGDGPVYGGELHFDDLQLPPAVYRGVDAAVQRVSYERLKRRFKPRARAAHKGQFGHVLVVGGNHGMAGAARMAAASAARVGAGRVSVATRPEHVAAVVTAQPEAMVHGIRDAAALSPLLGKASVVAVGPGFGQDDWSQALLVKVLETQLPLVVDADALNLIAQAPQRRADWILTPHPGEAARLLGTDTRIIAADRFTAAAELGRRYGGVVVLKGAGSLIHDSEAGTLHLCSDGNPGMASGGMGDVLTGVIAGLRAQGFSGVDAAVLGTCLHARAGDIAATQGERGLQAGDVIGELRGLVNPSWRRS